MKEHVIPVELRFAAVFAVIPQLAAPMHRIALPDELEQEFRPDSPAAVSVGSSDCRTAVRRPLQFL
jgi:hypothetical protein